MTDKIIIGTQDDLDKHFESHGVKCGDELSYNHGIYRNHGRNKGDTYLINGCPICLKEFQTITKESRNYRAIKMLDNFSNMDNDMKMYKQFIRAEHVKTYPDYKYIANCCFRIELLKQEEDNK